MIEVGTFDSSKEFCLRLKGIGEGFGFHHNGHDANTPHIPLQTVSVAGYSLGWHIERCSHDICMPRLILTHVEGCSEVDKFQFQWYLTLFIFVYKYRILQFQISMKDLETMHIPDCA